MKKLSCWEKAGMKRIYINGLPFGVKAWFEDANLDMGGGIINHGALLKTRCDFYSYQIDELNSDGGEGLVCTELGITKNEFRKMSFDQLFELVGTDR